MAKYEAVFILDPRKVEDDKGEAFAATIEEQLKALGAEITRVKCLDKKTFARPIGKHKVGIYWDYVVEMGPQCVAQLEDKYRLNQTVLRLCVFSFVEGQDDDVFTPREEHERLFKEEAFQDVYDREERPYRGRDDR